MCNCVNKTKKIVPTNIFENNCLYYENIETLTKKVAHSESFDVSKTQSLNKLFLNIMGRWILLLML